jgi:hypothetical protein
MTIAQTQVAATQTARTGTIDCDVHPMPRSLEEIRGYMPMPWRDRYTSGGRGFYNNPIHGARLDSKPPDGPTGSDPDFLRRQLIDEYGIAYAILLPRAFCNLHPDPDFGTAIAAAFNDWLADTWLSKYNHDGIFKCPWAVLRAAQPLPAPGCATVPGSDQGHGAAEQARRVPHSLVPQSLLTPFNE